MLRVKNQNSVLIVDDDSQILELLKECLEEYSFKVFTAKDGQEALHFLSKNEVDGIVTDVVMPKMAGPELIQKLSEQNLLTPFFYITGYTDHPRENLNLYKPLAIIFKPFDIQDAGLLIKNLLKKK